MSEDQIIIHISRRKIEELMTLKCPNIDCQRPFVDIIEGGCMALQCKDESKEENGCGAYFCAWCLELCADSPTCHRHVASCSAKPAGADTYWDDSSDKSDWKLVTRRRQCKDIISHLGEVEKAVRYKVISAVLPRLMDDDMLDMFREAGQEIENFAEDVDRALQLRSEGNVDDIDCQTDPDSEIDDNMDQVLQA